MPTKQATHPVQAHAMLRNSPTYQAFIDQHGRWVTQHKAAKVVRVFASCPIDEAKVKVSDWLDTQEVITRKADGMLCVASLFLAMGY